MAQWIRRPTSNRKIVGSIPIVVIFHNSEQFKWHQGYCDPPPDTGWLIVSGYCWFNGSVLDCHQRPGLHTLTLQDLFIWFFGNAQVVSQIWPSAYRKHCWFSGRILACHAGDRGSIPRQCTGFSEIFKVTSMWNQQTLRVGFEPTREDPIWFRVKRLNHSAIAARDCWHTKYWWWLGSLLNRRKVVLRWIQSEYEVNTVHASYVYTNR